MANSQSDRQRKDQEDCEAIMDRTRYKQGGFLSSLGCGVIALISISLAGTGLVELVQHFI